MTQIYKRNVALQKRLDEIKERKETIMKLTLIYFNKKATKYDKYLSTVLLCRL